MDAHAEAEAVKQRHRREHPVPRTEHGIGGDDLLGEGVEVPVGQDDALGGAGGAAGVEDDRRVVGLPPDLVVIEAGVGQAHELLPADDGRVLGDGLDPAALGEHVARAHGLGERVLDRGDDDVHDAGVLADGLEFMIKLVERDGRHGFGLVEVELDLLLGGERVDHVRNAAHEVHGVEHVNGLRAVRHGDRDLVARAHADGPERPGAALGLADQLAVGRGPAHKIEGDVVGVLLRDLRHLVEHGAFKVVQVHGDLPHLRRPGRFGANLSRHFRFLSALAPLCRGGKDVCIY